MTIICSQWPQVVTGARAVVVADVTLLVLVLVPVLLAVLAAATAL